MLPKQCVVKTKSGSHSHIKNGKCKRKGFVRCEHPSRWVQKSMVFQENESLKNRIEKQNKKEHNAEKNHKNSVPVGIEPTIFYLGGRRVSIAPRDRLMFTSFLLIRPFLRGHSGETAANRSGASRRLLSAAAARCTVPRCPRCPVARTAVPVSLHSYTGSSAPVYHPHQ